MSPIWYEAVMFMAIVHVTFGQDPAEPSINMAVDRILEGMELRLSQQTQLLETGLETRLAEQTRLFETRLAEQRLLFETRMAARTRLLETTIAMITRRLETRLAEQTRLLETRVAEQTRLLETRLAQHTNETNTNIENLQLSCAEPYTYTPTTTDTSITTPTKNQRPTTRPTTTPTTTDTPPRVVFLRRQDGSVDFYQHWAAYKSGFGNHLGEFWLGLDNLHSLTTLHHYSLRADLEDWSGETKWTEYSTFRVAGEGDGYRLTVTGYNPNSTAGGDMWVNNGFKFTTRDRDNDKCICNCANDSQGAWWYEECTWANPTGLYKPASYRGEQGIFWMQAYDDLRSFRGVSLTLVNK